MPALRARPAAVGVAEVGHGRRRPTVDDVLATDAPRHRSIGARRLRWLLLAAIPSGLLSAVTNFIATDLVSAPLLWVAPLAIYLASFIVAFSPRGGSAGSARGPRRAGDGHAAVGAVRLGRRLADPRCARRWSSSRSGSSRSPSTAGSPRTGPDPSHLTEFYLCSSAGGALASGLRRARRAARLPGRLGVPDPAGRRARRAGAASPPRAEPRPTRRRTPRLQPVRVGFRGRVRPYLVARRPARRRPRRDRRARRPRPASAGCSSAGSILLVGARPWFLALATAFVLLLATFVLQPPAEFRARSFFGVTEVLRRPTGELTLLMNGTTVHGTQSTDPARRRIPQSYYVRERPGRRPLRCRQRSRRRATRGRRRRPRVPARSRPTSTPTTEMTFFEIDPVVIDVASDPRVLHVPLGRDPAARRSSKATPACRSRPSRRPALRPARPRRVLVGLGAGPPADGRGDRRRDPDHGSPTASSPSTSRTATTTSRRRSRPAVTGQGLTVLEKFHTPGAAQEPGESPSHWLAASRDRAVLDRLRAAGWSTVTPADRPFTDDYADLLRYLYLGQCAAPWAFGALGALSPTSARSRTPEAKPHASRYSPATRNSSDR